MYQNPDCQEVLKRINTTPSVLFLGQNYLNEAIATSDDSNFRESEDKAQCFLHYRGILSLRWNAIVSSSYDANIPSKCGDSFSFEARCQYDKSQIIDKAVNAGYFLFGQNGDSHAPSKPDLDLDSTPKDLFTNVLKRAIDSFGIVIIAGWDLETDWITPQILYNVLKDAPEHSVLLFGIDPQNALENKFIKELSKKQLSMTDIIKDSFYAFLRHNECFDDQIEVDEFSSDANVETLSLYSSKHKGGRIPFVLKIDKGTIYELNSKSIALLTDNIGTDTIVNNNDNLLRFSACKGDWSYYAPHNKLIINRQASTQKKMGDFYELTANHIENIAKSKKKRSRFICVTGIHYSGKTAALKSFALKNKNNYPIFYIDNYVDEVTDNTLKEFCGKLIVLPEEFSKAVLVICDFKANSDQTMQNICQAIRNKLTEISDIIPVVIGVTYSEYKFCKDQIETVSLSPTLTDDELKKIEPVYNFNSEIRVGATDNSIFEMLSGYYKFQYSPEAADLRAKMKESHKMNQATTQNDVSVAYAQIYDEEFSEFVKKGFLSSLKDALSKSGEEAAKIRDNLINLNDCIALSSEFGIELPANFVFRTLDWNNYKFLNALDADCFLRRTENGYRYINAYEAGKYLLYNYTDSQNTTQNREARLKEKEVEILNTIIETCNWNDYSESSIVISLIRKFAPGSTGKERNIIGCEDVVRNPQGKNWYYYQDYYNDIGNAILKCADNNAIAVIVAAAFLRRAYQTNSYISSGEEDELAKAYNCCKKILDAHASFDALSTNQKVEVYIEVCNVIIAGFSSKNDHGKYDFSKWDEFLRFYHSLIELYNKTDKLEATVMLSIWHRAAEKKVIEKEGSLLEQTMSFDSLFLPDIQSEYDFDNEIKKYEKIYRVYSSDFNVDSFKASNLKSWLLYQQGDSYKLEKGEELTKEKTDLARHILSVFNENDATKAAVYSQPILLKTKILCEWIEHFRSLPWAEENATNFEDRPFWDSLHRDSAAYLRLCDEKHFPAAFIKYIECIYSLVFDDGSYRFEENVRYSKKLSPWYLKRIGVADKDGQLLKFVIGTTPQGRGEGFRGQIFDKDSILSKLKYIHLSPYVQEYLSADKIRLTATNSIPGRPVNIFFNAAGATAAIPGREGGDTK